MLARETTYVVLTRADGSTLTTESYGGVFPNTGDDQFYAQFGLGFDWWFVAEDGSAMQAGDAVSIEVIKVVNLVPEPTTLLLALLALTAVPLRVRHG